ncbi:MAG: hypothetical protein ABIQ93_01995, partial [Saprospiraceae bacterium]
MEPLPDDKPYHNDHHPDPLDFARLDAADMSEREETALFQHLAGCPTCQAAFEAWVQNGRPSALDNDTGG